MKIEKLGYLGLDATDLEAWRRYGRDYIGFQVCEMAGGTVGLRMDERPFCFLLQPAQRDGVAFIGLEVADAAAFGQAREEIRAAGIKTHLANKDELALRAVKAMFWALDPDGNRVEWYHGAKASADPFVPGRPIGGFRTGKLGFGHLAMMTPKLAAMEHFYLDLIGFRVSDFMNQEVRVRWAHINARHHSLALVEGGERLLHHVMIEYEYMDDVGRLYDMALPQPGLIQATLGRHSNDHMLSFYSETPGHFLIESGWGGRLIDRDNWTPEELWCMSIWGHERIWQTPEMRGKLRAQNLEASRRGLLVPVDASARPGFALAL